MKTKNIFQRYKNFLALSLAAGIALAGTALSDPYFEISRHLDIFSSLYREVNRVYVDTVDPNRLMQEGIDAMLKTLDPYTSYIPESEADDYRFITTGTYGGIGATIRFKDDHVCISEPYEGFPAEKSGLRGGDIILELDGQSMKGRKTDELSRLLKGKPGTSVKLTIDRLGEAQPIEKVLVREEIHVKNVPYADILHGDIGYIRLGGFTENAGQEVRAALQSLQRRQRLAGLILDLRGNPGGLLNEAVNVANLFVARGHDIVSTRGKMHDWNKTYKAINATENDSIPLVLLVNSGSASASEIVAGSLQDLDRAVILGQRTYGKGLVQITRSLSHKAQVKITSSKYYIPSGRCIQAVDYSHRNADGSVGKIPDSLQKAFLTRNGRSVRDGGGIVPDVVTEIPAAGATTASLQNRSVIFDFATQYRNTHPALAAASDFRLEEQDFQDFRSFVAARPADSTDLERELENVKRIAVQEKYYPRMVHEYEALRQKLMENKKQDLLQNRKEILQKLTEEIVSRYYYQEGRMAAMLPADEEVTKAVELLHSPSGYQALLGVPKPAEEAKSVK